MSALPANPLLPIQITQYREGNAGIPYAHVLDSGKPGPQVAITALVHGNEVCGAHALDLLLREKFKPAKGKLTLIFCNVAAYTRFDPDEPTASRFVDEDMNRVWGANALDSERRSIELDRAREIEPLLSEIDLLLDLHSMQQPSPPLMLAGPLAKGRAFAAKVGVPATVVADQGHKAGLRMRDYGGFGDASSAKNALLVECGQHWEQASRDVAIETMFPLPAGHRPGDRGRSRPPQSRAAAGGAAEIRRGDRRRHHCHRELQLRAELHGAGIDSAGRHRDRA